MMHQKCLCVTHWGKTFSFNFGAQNIHTSSKQIFISAQCALSSLADFVRNVNFSS